MDLNDRPEGASGIKPRICFLVQAVFGTSFTYLTGGVFLSGLALLMGAGDVLVSYLAVTANLCGVLILFLAPFLNRFQSRKKLAVAFTILSRTATIFIAVIPALFPKDRQLVFFIPAVIAAYTLQAQTTVVLNQWMMGFMEEDNSGRYISMRQTLTLTVTVILSLAGGRWMDSMHGKYIGFAVLFTAAALMGVFEILLLLRTPNGARCQSTGQKCGFTDMIKLPLKNKCFTGFVIYILAFYLILNISDSFTTVYMLKYLALPYRTVTAMSLILSLPQVVLLSIWGKISDRMGHEFVLRTSIWLFAGETLFLSLVSSKTWYIFLPSAFLISSAANAGFVISVFNRRYELMPKQNRIIYDNFYTAGIGLGFLLGPMIGGLLKNQFESSKLLSDAVPFAGIRLLYIVSAIGILLLQFLYHRSHVNEKKCLCPCTEHP